jgi:hypothetical protein
LSLAPLAADRSETSNIALGTGSTPARKAMSVRVLGFRQFGDSPHGARRGDPLQSGTA